MPTRNLTQLQDQVARTIDAYGRTIEREILYNYAAALDTIRVDLGKVYERYAVNGKLTHAEMSKFNRLRNLEKQITNDIKPVFGKDQRLIDKMKTVTYDESFYRHGWAIDQSSGVASRWGLLNPDAVKAAVTNDFTELAYKKLRQDGLIRAQRAIRQGIIQGSSYPRMARLIKEQLIEPSVYDAMRIARTEGQRAMVQGQQATYDRAEEQGVEMEQIWDATLDSRTRASHGKLDGVAAKIDKYGNKTWNTDVGPVAGPLQSGVASFDIHCRCRVRGQIEGYGPEVRRVRGEGIQPYQTYDEWKAKQNGVGRSVSGKPKVKPKPTQPAFTPAKTIAEVNSAAQKYGYELHGVKNVNLGNEINRVMQSEINRGMSVPSNITVRKHSSNGALMGPRGMEIYGEKLDLNGLRNGLSVQSKGYDIVSIPVEDALAHTIRHEIGHGMQYTGSSKETSRRFKSWAANRDAANKELRNIIESGKAGGDDFGGYVKLHVRDAHAYQSEAWAELYAASHGGYIEKLPSVLQEFVRKYPDVL